MFRKILRMITGIICLVGIASCAHTKKAMINGHTIVTEYYNNCKVKKQSSYIRDSVLDGQVKEFFKNGTIKFLAWYKAGLQDSVEKCYFENGIQGTYEYFQDGKKRGNQYDYYEDGSIFRYRFAGPDDINYYCLYDSAGDIFFENGNMIGYTVINKDSLSVGETYTETMFLATPPRYAIINFDLKIKRDSFDVSDSELPIKNGLVTYSTRFDVPGVYILTHKLYCVENTTKEKYFTKRIKLIVR